MVQRRRACTTKLPQLHRRSVPPSTPATRKTSKPKPDGSLEIYPVIRPIVGNDSRSEGTCGVHAGAGEVNSSQVAYRNSQTDCQARGRLSFGPVGVADSANGQYQDEAQEELDAEGLYWRHFLVHVYEGDAQACFLKGFRC